MKKIHDWTAILSHYTIDSTKTLNIVKIKSKRYAYIETIINGVCCRDYLYAPYNSFDVDALCQAAKPCGFHCIALHFSQPA